MSRIRTFVAVDISESVRDRAASLIELLGETGASVRWVLPQNLHLTLQFLGDVPDADVYRVCRSVERAAEGHEPFRIGCRGVGAFPHQQRPRVVWLGIDDPEQRLVALQKAIESELFELGFPKEVRPYRPHLTIGRLARSSRRIGDLPTAMAEWEDEAWGEIDIDGCVVYSSQRGHEGPVYTAMSRIALTG